MRTRSAVTAAVCEDSDNEAPEEISLATGRQAAVSQQLDESHAVLEQQRAAKEKRRKRAALAKPAGECCKDPGVLLFLDWLSLAVSHLPVLSAHTRLPN